MSTAPRLPLVVITLLFSWETAEPGRAARAALLWTQRQASKVHVAFMQNRQENHKPCTYVSELLVVSCATFVIPETTLHGHNICSMYG